MLTELESCILGVVWREGPMSAYGVRSHFAASPTVTWSSSTGTVYPAIGRLRNSGLLIAAAPTGPRKRELLSITNEGRRSLRRWLTAVPPELGASTSDPIRTRVHFLAALPPRQRQQSLTRFRAVTVAAINELEREAASPAVTRVEKSEMLGTLGSLAELRARLNWLDEVERHFTD